jgi:cytidine deaminase
MTEISSDELVSAARAACDNAYAPYSGFRVGAAVRGASGRVYSGCNVENASYGATLCAERCAVAALVAGGEKKLTELAVWTEGDAPAMPCGVCRQVLYELGEDVLVVAACKTATHQTTLRALLPDPFVLVRR